MTLPSQPYAVPAARRLGSFDYRVVLAATAEQFGISVESFAQKGNSHISRDLAAWLARAISSATLRELSDAFGLTHPDSVSNLTRRADRALRESARLRGQVEAIRKSISKNANRS